MNFERKRLAEIIRFGIVGVVATALHYSIYLTLNRWIAPAWAYTVGYGLSFCANFLLSNYFTFRTRPTARKGVGFVLSHAANYLLQMGLLALFLHWRVHPDLTPLIVFAIVIPVNFLLVRFALKKL